MFAAAALGGAVTAGPAVAAASGFAPRTHRDAGELRKDPLDLRAAAFGQVGTQLSLTLRTRGAWPARGTSKDSLCVTLVGDKPAGQLCVGRSKSRHLTLRFRRARTGTRAYGHLRTVPGAQLDRSGRTLRALIYPRAIGLEPGDLRWFVKSHWRRGKCAHGCTDRLPNAGTLAATVSVYGAPRCFGAAERATDAGCANPALRRLVTPDPSDAELMPDLPCRPQHLRRYTPVVPCTFGATYGHGAARMALIGDSHAMSFRATVEVAAQALGWKTISLTRASCGFATEVDPGWPPIGKTCRRHVEKVLRWLREHPAVHTVILADSAYHGYTEDGLAALWSRIPESVHRIYAVVDVPRVSFKTAACVKDVRRRHAASTGACAVPRDDKSLPHDPVPGAVAKSGPRVHMIDLTRFFCDSEQCFPVIGGAYVYRDTNHMNLVFAPTLGPYLLEAMGLGP